MPQACCASTTTAVGVSGSGVSVTAPFLVGEAVGVGLLVGVLVGNWTVGGTGVLVLAKAIKVGMAGA